MYQNQAYAANQYMNNQVMSASKKKLLIMLYDGAIKNLKIAAMAIDEKNIEKTNTNLTKAQAILSELMSSLNFESGGEIARNLHQLYEYMYSKLVQANINKDKDGVFEVCSYMEELRGAWVQV